MEPIIAPIDKRLLQMEILSKAKFMKPTNKGENELYILCDRDAPNIMSEIGRLREISFRLAGGGTGKAIDVDEFDVCENQYQQLIVWNPKMREILGGYRYIVAPPTTKDLVTSELFNFSQKFVDEYLPYTIELGRSFVQPDYQSSRRSAKSIFALDNLWDGLGGLTVEYPKARYFFGKVTMYTNYNPQARNMIHFFLQKHFPDKDKLVTPIKPLDFSADDDKLRTVFTGKNYDDDHKILSREVRALGETIPPLINSYMNISPSMKTFGCAENYEFGSVEETGILISLADVYQQRMERHLQVHRPPRLANLLRKK